MAFVIERVPKDDWALYNSFQLYNNITFEKMTANEYAGWVVDRDRKIYFILTGVEAREDIMHYTLIWKKKKIIMTIYSGRSKRGSISDGSKRYCEICSICADSDLKKYEKEFIEIIKEFLQSETTKECVFEYIAEIRYRKKMD